MSTLPLIFPVLFFSFLSFPLLSILTIHAHAGPHGAASHASRLLPPAAVLFSPAPHRPCDRAPLPGSPACPTWPPRPRALHCLCPATPLRRVDSARALPQRLRTSSAPAQAHLDAGRAPRRRRPHRRASWANQSTAGSWAHSLPRSRRKLQFSASTLSPRLSQRVSRDFSAGADR